MPDTTLMTEQERREAQEAALRDFEAAVATIAIVFGGTMMDPAKTVRAIALKARGDIREAVGEGRS